MAKKGKKVANTPKTGSTDVRNYDPKNSDPGMGGGKLNIVKKYGSGQQKSRKV